MLFNSINKKCLLPGFTLLFLLFSGTSFATEYDRGLENLTQTQHTFRSVAKKVSPAVVYIKVEKTHSSQSPSGPFPPFDQRFNGNDLFNFFFGFPPQSRQPHQAPQKRRSVGQGSGFLITSDGYIMTNNHVVDDADTVSVQMLNGREYQAKIIGTDPSSDLAVIKISEKNLPFLSLGNSNNLEVGDWVLAIGNPFGLSHTLTAGIVSAKGRSGIGLNDYEDFIQTDAAINPGNSGGPLVNLHGDVVGINTAIFSRSGGYMGIGFAIPVDMARQIKTQLIDHGTVKRGRLGVYIQDLTQNLAESFGLDRTDGVVIAEVIEDSPAEDAGLKAGDIVLEIEGDKVYKVTSFRNRIAMTAPNSKIKLTILRNEKRKKIDVQIGELDDDPSTSFKDKDTLPKLGITLQALTPDLAERMGYEGGQGVLVSSVSSGSLAEQAGIASGALIIEIDHHIVTSVKQAKELLNVERPLHLFLIRQNNQSRYLAIKIP